MIKASGARGETQLPVGDRTQDLTLTLMTQVLGMIYRVILPKLLNSDAQS